MGVCHLLSCFLSSLHLLFHYIQVFGDAHFYIFFWDTALFGIEALNVWKLLWLPDIKLMGELPVVQ